MSLKTLLTAAAGIALLAGPALADRQEIIAAGSSTVAPYAETVVERFNEKFPQFKASYDSRGTGAGFRYFCGGLGEPFSDISGASRAITASEKKQCGDNGVSQITEIQIGFDGLSLANRKDQPHMKITKAQLWQALAADTVGPDGKIGKNPYKKWSDIDPSLPNREIEVLGPPPTSGTRDAWVELVMDKGCVEFDAVKKMKDAVDAEADAVKKADLRTKFDKVCKTMREDGRFIEAGENDNIIVQRLEANPNAYGIFGYSFLAENKDKLSGNWVNGVEPTFDTIASKQYPVSRPLFIYLKNAHVGTIPGLKEFVAEFTSEEAIGQEGYLIDKGLVPLLPEELKAVQQNAASMKPIALN
jgi:phosphate transport system substrate-binding protein